MKKVSSADQAVIASHLDPLMKEIDVLNRQDNVKAFEAILAQGVTSVQPSASDLAAWNVVALDALAAMVAAGEVSQPVLDQFQASLKAFRAQSQ
jgi:thiamine monophosphate kinase